MIRNLIGPKYLEKIRSSDYKSSVFAFAEIIDNSIDAGAQNIEIISTTKNKKWDKIYFIDDGAGMTKNILEKCVIFSETTNTAGSKKTGSFGFGLPNSSLSQCKEFSAISKIKNEWFENRINTTKMLAENSLELEENPLQEVTKQVNSILKLSNIETPKTIIEWSQIDKIDAFHPKTMATRLNRLIGRIHREMLKKGITIRYMNYADNNKKPNTDESFKINDPLFLTQGNTYISDTIIEEANQKTIPGDALYNTPAYFKKFITPKKKKETEPLFYLPESMQSKVEIKWHGKKYTINIKTAIAHPDIQKPGKREGGQTKVGKQIGYKMNGASNFPSGNIFWMRNNREISFGNYSFFSVAEPESRWWSIEISYNTTGNAKENVLDILLGLSNTKQSIKFYPDKESPSNTHDSTTESEKRQELISQITIKVAQNIKLARAKLKAQAKVFEQKTTTTSGGGSGGSGVPTITAGATKTLIDALGEGEKMSEKQIKDLTKKLKTQFPHLEKENIEKGVRQFSDIGIKAIVVYCSLDERDLFQKETFQGRTIILLNTEHLFYQKVIGPLKEQHTVEVLASIELMLTSMSRVWDEEFPDGAREKLIKEYFEAYFFDLKKLLNTQELLDETS